MGSHSRNGWFVPRPHTALADRSRYEGDEAAACRSAFVSGAKSLCAMGFGEAPGGWRVLGASMLLAALISGCRSGGEADDGCNGFRTGPLRGAGEQ
jgi:hypothetical protein